MVDEIIGICVVCNQKIKKQKVTAKKIDGLLLCGLVCTGKFLKEKKKWTSEKWDELCKMQALYEVRKREESNYY